MTNAEMLELINEFKKYAKYTGKVPSKFYPFMEGIFSAFFVWFADRKLK